MTWDNLIITLFTVSLVMVLKHLDTMPGYSCPEYCGADHQHYPLDLQSGLTAQSVENVKFNKTKYLATK
tara:strand:- start:2209 stop:2415 length:207 start_codon:yes stop_codon:yes gene_type:complete